MNICHISLGVGTMRNNKVGSLFSRSLVWNQIVNNSGTLSLQSGTSLCWRPVGQSGTSLQQLLNCWRTTTERTAVRTSDFRSLYDPFRISFGSFCDTFLFILDIFSCLLGHFVVPLWHFGEILLHFKCGHFLDISFFFFVILLCL